MTSGACYENENTDEVRGEDEDEDESGECKSLNEKSFTEGTLLVSMLKNKFLTTCLMSRRETRS